MSLSDLPREILLNIADHLGDRGINALALTNSQVYDLLNPHLYRRDVTKPRSKSLIWGAEYGVEGTIQQAIDAGQHFTPISKNFQTALEIAVGLYREYARLVELLLQVDGINPGKHLLGIAAARGHVNIVKLLLDHPGTDINFADREGRTALIRASKLEMVKLLLEQEGIDINRQDRKGHTALSRAVHYSGKWYTCEHRSLEVAKLLLERDDIDVNLREEDNRRTPLHWACLNDCQTLVDLLLEKDIDPNPRDFSWGHTPLAHVCFYLCGSVDLVRSLLSHPDTDPNSINNNGYSILAEMISLRNTDGFNPLHYQLSIEIESLLRAAGATYYRR